MKFMLIVVACLSLATFAIQRQGKNAPVQTVSSAVAAPGDTKAEEAIKHLLLRQVEAWNHADLEGFMNGYWRSPDLTFFSGGTISNGWQAALERYQRRYQGTGKEMGHLEFQNLKINVLSRDAAYVTGKWELTMSDGKKPHGLFTLILKNMSNGWQIIHDHTSSAEEK